MNPSAYMTVTVRTYLGETEQAAAFHSTLLLALIAAKRHLAADEREAASARTEIYEYSQGGYRLRQSLKDVKACEYHLKDIPHLQAAS